MGAKTVLLRNLKQKVSQILSVLQKNNKDKKFMGATKAETFTPLPSLSLSLSLFLVLNEQAAKNANGIVTVVVVVVVVTIVCCKNTLNSKIKIRHFSGCV